MVMGFTKMQQTKEVEKPLTVTDIVGCCQAAIPASLLRELSSEVPLI